jgi:hypothetical protein
MPRVDDVIDQFAEFGMAIGRKGRLELLAALGDQIVAAFGKIAQRDLAAIEKSVSAHAANSR